MENARLWGRLIDRHHRVLSSETVEIESGDLDTAILELCRRFDIERPIQLPKHQREFESFNTTFFSKEHFTEPIPFYRFEIELIAPPGQHKDHPRLPIEDA
ncbi:MAG: hypothetical protein IJ719_00995 [Clostridia bacterium]|nr:hypothetical protein [Clostridia bacterium]